ncbi:alanine racemase [Sphingomonas sp. BLCC-B65]|nr:alanine racemase [Sphingomonas sp. BLCC-B65]
MLATPALVIDAPTARRRIAETSARITRAGWRWRAHVKTARTPRGVALLQEARVDRFKAATLGEVRALLELGATDVLLAYPGIGPALSTLADLARKHPGAQLSALIDDAAALEEWPDQTSVAAMIDLDGGMDRTGVPLNDVAAVSALASRLTARGIRLAGLHLYDGHLADMAPTDRRHAVSAARAAVGALEQALNAGGTPIDEIVLGGTHTLRDTIAAAPTSSAVHSVGAGTLVYGDGRSRERFAFDGDPESVEPAAVVVTRVVSARRDAVTVDAGSASVQVDAGAPHVEVLHPRGLRPGALSQEHLVLRGDTGYGAAALPRVGSIAVLLPRHLDTAISQFETVLFRDEGSTWSRERVFGRH